MSEAAGSENPRTHDRLKQSFDTETERLRECREAGVLTTAPASGPAIRPVGQDWWCR